jgi:hypothetical protein
LRANRKGFKKGEIQDRRRHDWPLSGLLFCGHCGARMWGMVVPYGRGGKTELRRYTCSTYLEHGRCACQHNWIAQEVILPLVCAAVQTALSDEETVARLEAHVAAVRDEGAGDTVPRLAYLRHRAAELAAKVRGGIEKLAVLPSDLVDDLTASIRAWKEEREEALQEITRLDAVEAADADQSRLVGAAMEAFRRLGQMAAEASDLPETGDALQALVQKVELHFTHEERGKRRLSKFAWGRVSFRDPFELLGDATPRIKGRSKEESRF